MNPMDVIRQTAIHSGAVAPDAALDSAAARPTTSRDPIRSRRAGRPAAILGRAALLTVLAGAALLLAILVPSGAAAATPARSIPGVRATGLEPDGWYAGDMHVHRSCGGAPVSVASIYSTMVTQDLAVVSLLADMGNGEVQDPATDLPLVNGQDDPISTPGRIVHWDSEWHWDATYSQYAHQALGGHLVSLGLGEAHTIWDESTAPILAWAHQQRAIAGFAHMQYLGDGFPAADALSCCLPVEYPIEVALGSADFVSEDVNGSETAIAAYYRLLNCGLRPGLAGGTDYPCGQVIGPMVTYSQVAGGQLTYRGWIEGIARGRTVVSRVGHTQFVDLKVNGTASPGDEIQLSGEGDVQVAVQWSSSQSLSRTIELVSNGTVVASTPATASPGAPGSLASTLHFTKSGWICARVMDSGSHDVHTAAVFVTVDHQPVRASAADAQFYADWIDNLITNTSPGGPWNHYFPTELAQVQARYQAARSVYQQIASGSDVAPLVVTQVPGDGATGVAVQSAVTVTFSEPLDPATVSASTLQLKDASNAPVAATVSWDAGLRTATLTPSAPLSPSSVYTVTLTGGTGGVSDPAGTPLAASSSWSFTTLAPDNTPPTVLATVPAAGATGIAPTTTVRATFSEAMDPATITAGRFLLRDPADALVPSSVSYDVPTHVATLTPLAPLATGLHTATLTSDGVNGPVRDLAGNAMSPDVSWSFTVGFTCPCTIWSPTTSPSNLSDPDAKAIEAGVKFRASVAGWVTGVRFYKSTNNTGTHVGNLWASDGTRLATVTFTGESASGWQEATFDTPVAIAAGTTYIASYHAPNGHYSGDVSYFASGVDAGPLRALKDGEDGPNGVYVYASSSAFPTENYNATNYWVDVVFATSVGPDVTPPQLTARVPGPGATNVAVGTAITATFNEALDAASVNANTFDLRDANGVVPATVSWNAASRTATLAPSAALAYSTVYTATLHGGAADPRVKDAAGNALAADVSWSFTTAAQPPPPPDEGPGGPILVIASAANPFTRYYAEILRAEGFNEFTVTDIANVTRAVLDAHDIAILGEMTLGAAQATMLSDWVTAGGRLIAMRPDHQLAGLLGITDASSTLADQYLSIDTASGPGRGITGETMQFHGTADLYALAGATAVATLYANATTATSHPAVTLRSLGGGGRAAAFTYDLARSVVYTRQGNPAWVGQERDMDAVNVIRSDDLFFGRPTTPPSDPEWVDRDKLHIPQADEQQRLLANLIHVMTLDLKPLPRFWYLPRGLKAAIMMRGDDHGTGNTPTRFDQYLAQSPSPCSLDDWTCVRSTSFIYTSTPMDTTQVRIYTNQGFEVGLHLDSNLSGSCTNYRTDDEIETFYSAQLAAFTAKYPQLGPSPVTNIHCGTWSMWVGLAKAELRHGNRLDGDYYYWVGWPPNWLDSRPGVFTGSAIPMRFADLDGSMVDVYQVPTQMTDESGQTYPMTVDSLLNRAVDARGYYGIYHANMHTDYATEAASDQIVQHAQARGVPVVSCRQVLTWLDGRNNSSFRSLVWNGTVLSFEIAAAAGSTDMEAMLPVMMGAASLKRVERDGASLTLRTETIKGVAYGFFPATSGTYAATYEQDLTAPVISAVTATPALDGTATIAWTTDEPSDSRVDYGTDPGVLTPGASDVSDVTSHSLKITGLAGGTTYYYRVTSADPFANSATWPAPPNAPASFATPAAPCLTDRTAADFALGTAGSGVSIVDEQDGEVVLTPTLTQDFGGTALPADWMSMPWDQGQAGTATVGGGLVTLDAARVNPSSTTGYSAGSSVEFVATFQAANYQGVGFGAGDNSGAGLGNIYPIALFGTANGLTLKARSGLAQSTETQTDLPGLVGAPHRYRIDWLADRVDFYVDGALVASHPNAIGGTMRPSLSDFQLGGPVLTVDWIRAGPYATAGTYTSRVFDAGNVAHWGNAFWTADVPAGASLAVSVRTGATAVPDGSWTGFTSLAASGAPILADARYIQYRAELATANTAVTPVLRDLTATCDVAPHTTPPVIGGVSATLAGNGTSELIRWTTDEPADSRVDYGTSPGSLTSSASDAALVTSHAVTLTGLGVNTAYYYRVVSTDAAHLVATSPEPPAEPLHFNTPVSIAGECLADRTTPDFARGTLDGSTYLSETTDGEVILAPAAGTEFSGPALSPGWAATQWNAPSGTYVLANGRITLNGMNATPTGYSGPYGTFDCVVTFTAETFQHAGLENFAASGAPYAIFSTNNTTNNLYARVPGSDIAIPNGGSYIGSAHHYRLVWTAASVEFWIDGARVVTQNVAIATPMRPLLSDYGLGAEDLSADWIRFSPYAASGTYLSRVYDAGAQASWLGATWSADVPAGTGLTMSVRHGDTPTPDANWSTFAVIPSSGQAVGGASRYAQYRADLTTSDPASTPALKDFVLECLIGADNQPPVISSVVATPDPGGHAATITWTTGEAADSRVDYGTSPGALASSATDPALVFSHSLTLTGLLPETTYHFRVTSTDASHNAATEPAPPAAPLTFLTPASLCAADAVAADFAAGTLTNTYVATGTDGEVLLAPAIGAEFSGNALPGDWMAVPWNNPGPGTTTVAGGVLTVDGQRVNPASLTTAGPGVSLEFRARFEAQGFQGVGFGAGDNSTGSSSGLFMILPFALFGTGNGTEVKARSGSSGATETQITGLTGAFHLYRIDWRADRIDFFVDGTLVASHPPIATGMRVAASDYTEGAPALKVDWLRLSPYAASGAFTSRVFDAGAPSSWGAMSWTADVPSGTSLAMQVRKGNTLAPDTTWTAWTPVASSGATVGGVSRYIQYSAALTANAAGDQTPSLKDVGILCGACDAGAPTAIADLGAIPAAGGTGGRTGVKVSWTAVPQGSGVAVYRRAFGDYPLYRADHGAAPAPPATPAAALAQGWTLAPVTAPGALDVPPARGFWYYAAFVTNACGVTSAPSNLSAGALDYLLGDVSDGASTCASAGEAGDGVVSTPDLSALGANYGQSFPITDERVCLDVGPTSDYALRSMPHPDGRLDFEDLVLYALNFEVPLPALAARQHQVKGAASVDALEVDALPARRAGETFDVVLRFQGSGAVHALSVDLAWDGSVAEFVSVSPGALLASQGGLVLTPQPGRVDAAVLGRNAAGLQGDGELAVVRFRARADGDPAVRIAAARARDAANHPVLLGESNAPAPVVPRVTRLGPVFPNPFHTALNVSFSLARGAPVRIEVLDLAGRVMRHLENGFHPAGVQVVTWDGRGDSGEAAAPGSYLLRFQAGEFRQTRWVQLIR